MNATWQSKCAKVTQILTLLRRVLKVFWQVVVSPSLLSRIEKALSPEWDESFWLRQCSIHEKFGYDHARSDSLREFAEILLDKKSYSLQKTPDGSTEIVLVSSSGNKSHYATNSHQHRDGYPYKIVYRTGDTIWQEPDGSVRLVRASDGKYWK